MTPFVDFPGATVRVQYGEHIDSALRRFKKAMQRAGILSDARKHEHWVPRPERRRSKSATAQKRRGF